MEANPISINVEAGNDELTILTGNAPITNRPTASKFSCSVLSISEYINKLKPSPETAVIYFDSKQALVNLYVNPSNELSPVITGHLVPSVELQSLGINQNKLFKAKDLANTIRFMRRFMAIDDYDRVMRFLEKTNLKFTTDYNDKDDRKGNLDKSLKRTITSEQLECFSLQLKPYQDFEGTLEFDVDVLWDIRNNEPNFWLESIKLQEEQEAFKRVIFQQLKNNIPAEYCVLDSHV